MVYFLIAILSFLSILLTILLILTNKKFNKIENSLFYNEKRSTELDSKIENSFKDQRSEIVNNLNYQISSIREENERTLENIRQTVDEKLQNTLDKKITNSFSIVNNQLDNVSKGLGEVSSLVSDVGDLKRVLQNVKARGTWGEVQLEALLSDTLNANQYVKNLKYQNGNIVEFAIKIPSKDLDNKYIYLPIDCKFPKEDYENLINSLEEGDKQKSDKLTKQLNNRIKSEAKSISEKYIKVPQTTSFAILYLPYESLYIQVLKTPGMLEELQNTYNVNLSGPSTISAFLNSLQLGFRTLAIEKRTSDVWNTLNNVKREFKRFEEEINRMRSKSEALTNSFDLIDQRVRTVTRSLKDVEDT